MASAMTKPSSYRDTVVAEHLRASKRVMKDVLATKANARKFLIAAGILSKSGKGLAKPYR